MTPIIFQNNGKGLRLSANDVSARSRIGGKGDSLVLTNSGFNNIYVAIGSSTIEADLTGYLILPGTKEDNIVLDPEIHAAFYADPWIAVICESGVTGFLSVHRVSR